MSATRQLLLNLMMTLVLLAQPAWGADQPHTVLITGANRGIGFEFVKQYADKGWTVIATCRNPEAAENLNAFAAQNEGVVVERLDVLDHAGIDALAARYQDQPVDVLLNNAGLMRGPDPEQTIGTIDYQEFDRFYHINVVGPLKVSEAFYPNVAASEYKTIVALTTGKGRRGIPVPGFSLYKSSKAALDSLQQEMAIRWRREGAKVVTLLPGRVLTHGEQDSGGAGVVDIEVSISGMIQVLDNLTAEQSGHTIGWDGTLIE
jgi:NAD(P)-dependent dehydrogenase (short-subunit alcohol dehydrogenase family)